MRVMIAGGTGFLGDNLRRVLSTAGHEVQVLTRRHSAHEPLVHWDATGEGRWTEALEQCDAVVNACGYGLEHWPWNRANRRRFHDSRILPGLVLTAAITQARRRPRVFVQFSGVNRYGLRGPGLADESTPVGEDYMARLTVPWEDSTAPLEALGVRRVIVRNAVVLHASRGLFPLMTVACRLFFGGRFGGGNQYMPWIHFEDHANAVRNLLEDNETRGPYNLVAPTPYSNAEFMRILCRVLRRPYWFHVPAFPLRLVLGEMAGLILDGRAIQPRRLLESGFRFKFPDAQAAFRDVFSRPVKLAS